MQCDKLGEKFDKFEKQLKDMRKEIDDIRDIKKTTKKKTKTKQKQKQIKNQDETLEKEEGHHHEVADRLTKLENINYDKDLYSTI